MGAAFHTTADDRAEHMTLAGRGVYLMLLLALISLAVLKAY